MKDAVLSLTAVMPNGDLIRTARRAKKTSAGYDLSRLLVGSEGTLGVITEVTLRLYGIPEAIAAAVCPFPTIEDAVNTVIETIQSGIPVARIELLDDVQMDAINKYSKLAYKVAPTLFFEFHGTERGVEEQSAMVKALAAEHGAPDFKWATTPEERSKLWQARHDAYYAALALKPGSKGWATDVCVPISRLAECISETKRDLSQSFVLSSLVGHVGDGNFHIAFMIDPNSPEEIAEAARLNERMVHRALAMDGTCTGEHGIGWGKMDFLIAEHGEAVSVMRTLKKALDPDNIMNPGKIVRV
jgi:D-lactate dehydrogenase (cytochrome)